MVHGERINIVLISNTGIVRGYEDILTTHVGDVKFDYYPVFIFIYLFLFFFSLFSCYEYYCLYFHRFVCTISVRVQ